MGTKKGTGRRRAPDRAATIDMAQIVADILAEAGEPLGFHEMIAPYHLLALDPRSATNWLIHYEARYDETKNPVFVWEALGLVLGSAVAAPAWVTAYFARTSERLHLMSRTQIPEKDLPVAVYRALEFVPTRGVNPFRAVTDGSHDVAIAYQVLLQIRAGHKPYFAIASVAEQHPSQCDRTPRCESIGHTTVELLWEHYRPALMKKIPKRTADVSP